MEKKKMEITVAGQSYTLLTDEDPAEVKAITDSLNRQLAAIMANSRISLTQALILAAMDLTQEAAAQREAAEKLKAQIGDYLEDAEHAKTERDHYKREYDKLLEKTKPQG